MLFLILIYSFRPPASSTPLHFRTSSLRPESSSRSCTPPRGPHPYHQCDPQNRIPPRDAESERQSNSDDTKEHPPVQTSSSAHSWHLRGQSEDDPEREPIRVCASDCGGDAAAIVGHSETRPASILLRDGYISRGLDGRIALDLPDRLCVLSMRALKVHTCNQLVRRAAL